MTSKEINATIYYRETFLKYARIIYVYLVRITAKIKEQEKLYYSKKLPQNYSTEIGFLTQTTKITKSRVRKLNK